MFKTKKSRKEFIITLISAVVSIIIFYVARITVRGNMSEVAGGELLILLIPVVVYFAIKNWKLFMETCFPKDTAFKDTTFDDYFDEYFTGKDMIEDKPSNVIGIDDFITR
jgi:hypothetical protein